MNSSIRLLLAAALLAGLPAPALYAATFQGVVTVRKALQLSLNGRKCVSGGCDDVRIHEAQCLDIFRIRRTRMRSFYGCA